VRKACDEAGTGVEVMDGRAGVRRGGARWSAVEGVGGSDWRAQAMGGEGRRAGLGGNVAGALVCRGCEEGCEGLGVKAVIMCSQAGAGRGA
jgi:hypothetical protein